MRHRPAAFLGTLVGLVFLSLGFAPAMAQAPAGAIVLKAELSGTQEVPPVTTRGSGWGIVTYDPATKRMTYSLNWLNFDYPATAAHFHGPAFPGENVGVVVPIGGANPTSPVTGEVVLTDAQAAELLASRWYVNVHTARNPGGEIRSQVVR